MPIWDNKEKWYITEDDGEIALLQGLNVFKAGRLNSSEMMEGKIYFKRQYRLI